MDFLACLRNEVRFRCYYRSIDEPGIEEDPGM
jgi:hypothetical protein